MTSRIPYQLFAWTMLLCCINVGLYLIQIFNGVDAMAPSPLGAVHWGADFSPLTLSSEPWRLFTSMFFHFGLMHLMFNMWALYQFGQVAEIYLGHWFFLALYILSGLAGSLANSYMNLAQGHLLQETLSMDALPTVSAGASGAIMGVAGAPTLLSLLPKIKSVALYLNRKSLMLIMAINIAIGFAIPQINQAAHIGGLIMGAILGCFWWLHQKTNQRFAVHVLGIMAMSWLCYYLYQGFYNDARSLDGVWQPLIQMSQHSN